MSNKQLRTPGTAIDQMELNADIQAGIESFLIAAIALERGLNRVRRHRTDLLLPGSTVKPADALFTIGVKTHQLLMKTLAQAGFIENTEPAEPTEAPPKPTLVKVEGEGKAAPEPAKTP